MLASTAFQDLLKELSSRYDLVIVDTPPLSVLADAASVARATDGVLVVARVGRTERQPLATTLDRLDRAGAFTVGLVLNDSEVPTGYQSYSYGS